MHDSAPPVPWTERRRNHVATRCRHVAQTKLTSANSQEWAVSPRYQVQRGQTVVSHLWLIIGDELMYMSQSADGGAASTLNSNNPDKDADVQEMFLSLTTRVQDERGGHQTMEIVPNTIKSKAALTQHYRQTFGAPPLHEHNVTRLWHLEPTVSNIVDLVRSVSSYLEALIYKGDENLQLTSDQAQENTRKGRDPPAGPPPDGNRWGRVPPPARPGSNGSQRHTPSTGGNRSPQGGRGDRGTRRQDRPKDKPARSANSARVD